MEFVRLAELAFASRISMRCARLGLVVHTEGLVNPSVAKALLRYGRESKKTFRPTLTVVTPRSPQFPVDPLRDPVRTDFTPIEVTEATEKDFASRLSQLADYFDIGYHGHFFSLAGRRYRPSFNPKEIESQFNAELEFLKRHGHKPYVYAGGWWHFFPELGGLLKSKGFKVDTTLNDIRLDSFSRPQPYPRTPAGQPFWIAEGVVEVPSIRSIGGLMELSGADASTPKFAVLALHDYDFSVGSRGGTLDLLLMKLARKRNLVSLDEIMDQAMRVAQ